MGRNVDGRRGTRTGTYIQWAGAAARKEVQGGSRPAELGRFFVVATGRVHRVLKCPQVQLFALHIEQAGLTAQPTIRSLPTKPARLHRFLLGASTLCFISALYPHEVGFTP